MQNNEQAREEDMIRENPDDQSKEDSSSQSILNEENLIDPGNEHHHSGANSDRSVEKDADAGSDATGTTGPEPGEGEHDEPDVSGEDG